MKQINLMDDSNQDKLFVLIYGASGTGKTELIGTLGELGKVLVVDIDKGYKTLKFSKRVAPYKNNLVVVSFDQFKDLDSLYKLAHANDPKQWSRAIGVEEQFDWIVLDTWSEMQWQMSEKLRKDKDMSGKGLDYRANLQIQHWGALTDLNKLSVEAFRECTTSSTDRPVNIVITMQETMSKDDISGQIFGGPAIHGKLVNEMPAYFDVVIHTSVDLQGNFVATTKPKGKWPAKTRIKSNEEYKNPYAREIFQ